MFSKTREEIVYKGYRSLLKRQFELPSGKLHDYDIVQGDPVVCALVVDTNGRLVVTKQFRPGPERFLYVLPGGMMDPGETPAEAIARECFEETGYRGDVIPLASTWAGAYSTTIRHHFVIRDATPAENPKIDPDEIQEVVVLDKDELLEKMWAGEVMDIETLLLGFEMINN